MSIRMIAKDLYQLQQEVEKLERELKAAPAGQREGLEQRLLKARAERDQMRARLDANKEPTASRKPR